jgi:hypothetical protein
MQLLVRRDAGRYERLEFLDVDGGALCRDDKGLRDLTRLLVGTGDDGGVGHLRVLEQDGLEFGGRDLKALVLDEFLGSVRAPRGAAWAGPSSPAGALPCPSVSAAPTANG